VALGTVAVLAVYLMRAGDLAGSIWNPHLIVLPTVAMVVAFAAASVTDGVALMVAVTCLSFVAQSSVSVVPFATTIAAAAMTTGICGGRGTGLSGATLRRWLCRAGVLLTCLWLPPLIEQFTASNGNASQLARFFLLEQHDGQEWATALWAWGDVTTAFTRPGLALPWGATFEHRGNWGLTGLALAQLVLLAPAGLIAHRRGATVVARLCGLTAAGSLVA